VKSSYRNVAFCARPGSDQGGGMTVNRDRRHKLAAGVDYLAGGPALEFELWVLRPFLFEGRGF
jgi:hypothetical protein